MRAPQSTLLDKEAEAVVRAALEHYEDTRLVVVADATNPNHWRVDGEDPVFIEKYDPRTRVSDLPSG
jgi:hypothetical protein